MKRIVYIGMDVHSTNFTFCSLEPKLGGEDKVFGCMQSEADVKNVLKYIEGLKKELGDDVEFLCGYEAGCLGFSLYHQLKKQGVECVILAPSTMMASKGKRIKTDARDAKRIAQHERIHSRAICPRGSNSERFGTTMLCGLWNIWTTVPENVSAFVPLMRPFSIYLLHLA